MEKRIHPITILANLWRVFYLVIIPVIRGFLVALRGDLSAWASGAWLDIIIFLVMILYAVIRWYQVRYRLTDECIELASGILFQKRSRIAWEKISTMAIVKSYYLKPFRAVHFRADTLGGVEQRMDLNILLSPRAAQEAQDYCLRINPSVKASNNSFTKQYIPDSLSIWIHSVLTSNSFGGIIFIATFISQSGKLLGNEFSDMIIGTFEEAMWYLAFGIPPAAAAIAYVLLAGWLIGFILTVIRYRGFSISQRPNHLVITSGIITERIYNIKNDSIYLVDVRQSLFTKILGLYSLYIYAVGYGKQKDDIACVIPAENKETFDSSRELLFPGFNTNEPRQIKPKWTGVVRYISDPMLFFIAIITTMVVTIYLVPSWSTFIKFVGLMLLVPVLLFLAVRLVEFATAGFSVQNGFYTIRYSKGLSIHKVVVAEEHVVKIKIQQSLFQRFGSNCDLLIYTKAEGRQRHKCRNLDKHQLRKLLQF